MGLFLITILNVNTVIFHCHNGFINVSTETSKCTLNKVELSSALQSSTSEVRQNNDRCFCNTQ